VLTWEIFGLPEEEKIIAIPVKTRCVRVFKLR
jgi:hypothetical protein